jgi:hypothetical protein
MKAEPPIRDVDRLDVLGRKHGGGLDMGILVDGPLDNSPQTLNLL